MRVARAADAVGTYDEPEAEFYRANGVPRARLMHLLDWRDGQFEFTPAAIGGHDEVGATVTQLLLEHARAKDEENTPVPPRR